MRENLGAREGRDSILGRWLLRGYANGCHEGIRGPEAATWPPLSCSCTQTPAQTRAVFRDADPRPWGARKLWCVCARVCVCTRIPSTWSCAVPYVHVFICLCMCVCTCLCVCMCFYACVCVCMHAFRTSSHIQSVQGSVCIQRGLVRWEETVIPNAGARPSRRDVEFCGIPLGSC